MEINKKILDDKKTVGTVGTVGAALIYKGFFFTFSGDKRRGQWGQNLKKGTFRVFFNKKNQNTKIKTLIIIWLLVPQ